MSSDESFDPPFPSRVGRITGARPGEVGGSRTTFLFVCDTVPSDETIVHVAE
jgi:hypothetical protein